MSVVAEQIAELRADALAEAWAERGCVTCPDCGGTTAKVTESAPSTWRASVILRCTRCPARWQINAHLTRVERNNGHGTMARYRKHLRDGDPACTDCKHAYSTYVQERKRARQ